MQNQYFNLDAAGATAIDLDAAPVFARGKDYYIDIFREIERRGSVRGLTFYLTETSPETLPRTGKDVVLVLVSDEAFSCEAYWPDLFGVIRTYPPQPAYLDGWPGSHMRLMALIHYLYKSAHALRARLKASLKRKDLAVFALKDRIFHTPLGTFFRFRPEVRPMAARSINFAFLGSVEYGQGHQRLMHRLLTPPKLKSRKLMLAALDAYAQASGDPGAVRTTGDFEESIRNQDGYARALQDCKISVCPRGSNPETYRFFESCASGCVVVCEALPEAWFYRGHPAVIVRDWSRLPGVLKELLADTDALQQRASATQDYWQNRLSESAIATRIEAFLLTGSRAAAEGAH